MEVCGASALPRSDAVGEDIDDLVVLLPGKLFVGVGATAEVEEVVLVPVLIGAGRYDLLGQHVQGPGRDGQGVQVAATDAPEQGDALQQLVAGQREESAFWHGSQ